MSFRFSLTSEQRLKDVHPDLQRVVRRALELSPVDFGVTEGRRTEARQAQMVAEGKSQTMNGRHLTGHAVDLAAYPDGKLSWDMVHYRAINDAMQRAAGELGVPIVWGGSWKTLVDGPHWELDRRSYPA